MEEGQDVAATSSSLVDTPVEDGKAVDSSLPDDEGWLTDCDEETDEAFYLNREGKKRREEFYNAGYRDGLTAGKNDAAQDGFNQGFKDSVMVGYKWGIIRGVTSALAHIPDELKSKLVETEDKRKEFLKLHEAVDSMATEDVLKLYYADIKRGASERRKKLVETEDKRKEFLKLHEAVDSMATEDVLKLYYADIKRGASERRKNAVASVDSSVFRKSSSEQSELERYFDNPDLLLKETPVGVQLKLNEHRVS